MDLYYLSQSNSLMDPFSRDNKIHINFDYSSKLTVIKIFFYIYFLFSGLYANTDISEEPMSAGRQMGAHFSTVSLNEDGSWKDLINQRNYH